MTIQRYTQTRVTGQLIETYSDLMTVWAFVEPLAGRDLYLAGQMKADLDTRITMRGLMSSGVIKPNDQVLWTDNSGTLHTYKIDSIVDVGGYGATLQLMCVERVQGN